MRTRFLLAATAVFLLLAARVAVAQGEGALAGEWRNRNQTGSIIGANIYQDGGKWMVQLLGKCTPNPCIWNPEPLIGFETAPAGGAPHALATFQQSNMRRVMTFRLGEDTLIVEVYSMAAPVPSRGFKGRNVFSVDELSRTKSKAARLTPSRPPVPVR